MLTPVEEIKSKLDIVELIQEYLPLKQSGANWKGLCPFHNEKTPSFMVSREKQFFKCFGCSEGGDMFTFLQKMENIEFPEALKILAEKAGVQLRQVSYNPQMQNLKTRLYDLHSAAVKFFQDQLFNSESGRNARDYLINSRKFNKDILDEFKIGYAPDSWDMLGKFLINKGFGDNEIKQSGLVSEKNKVGLDGKNYYDRFRDRIMFPITDHHGNIVGFTARAMKSDSETSGAKYINTPQTIIYNKSQILYGLDKAKTAIKKSNFVILVEGNMDVIASHKAGIKNIVASSGTSLTLDQINILKRYTKNLAMCFDADEAGIKAGERGIELAWQNGMSVKVIILPCKIKDPDELIKQSVEAWHEAINKKMNFMEYLLGRILRNKNLEDIDIKQKIIKYILPWLVKLGSPVEKDHYLRLLANKLNITENSLREEMSKVKIPNSNFEQKKSVSEIKISKINKHQLISQRLLALIISQPEYLKKMIDNLAPELVENSFKELYKELIFYYTKSNAFDLKDFYNYLKAEKGDLAFVFDTLKLLAETEFLELSQNEISHEFNLALNFLKKQNISQRLKQIEREIKNAEQSGNPEYSGQKADELMKEFAELSRSLSGL